MTPILVTGVPRSGTTWLARLLARSPGTALAGREPMNPRGRQYALGHTLTGWSRLTELTPKQRLLLRAAYSGRNPFVYSRYGTRQWAAVLPRTRMVIKDPYALLSTPAITRATGARVVLVYRHPAAILASYQRVGWTPRVDEVAALSRRLISEQPGLPLPRVPSPGETSPTEELGTFWATLYELALRDLPDDALVVSHAELASGGEAAGRALAARLALTWSPGMGVELTKESAASVAVPGRLHNFDRSPASVAEEWRSKLTSDDVELIEQVAGSTLAKLDAARLQLT